jgi:MFS-type transporter involved in bile tolerance (Atg22 family)
MFALLALAGDLGASVGPSSVGKIAGMVNGDLKYGLLLGSIFPALLIVGLILLKKKAARGTKN